MKNIYLFIGNFFLLGIFIAFSVLMILNPDKMTGFTLQEYTNDYCQSEEASIKAEDSNDPISLICNNKYKKEKFIWIFLDGLAYDQLFKLPYERHKHNLTNFFRIVPKEYKQSGSLHESIITGKFSRNYPAKATQIDHIFRQVHKANQTLHYVGSSFPLFYLLGREQSKELYHYRLKKPECFALDGLCPGGMNNIHNSYPQGLIPNVTDASHSYLKPEITKDQLYDMLMQNYTESQTKIKEKFDKCLDEDLFEAERRDSLIYYTMRLDHLNHSYDKKHIITLFNIFSTETGIMGLIEWIDLHPEYALIISSDHGGQKYNGEDDICNHGCDNEGNEAIFFVYTKELGMNYTSLTLETQKIYIENIAPTVAQILKGVNIPLEAQGIPYTLGKDNLLWYTSAKSKEIQLKVYIEMYLMKYPHKESIVKPLVDKLNDNEYSNRITDIKSIEQMDELFYMNYLQYLNKVQLEINQVISSDSSSFLYSLLFYCIIVSLFIKVFVELRYVKNIIFHYSMNMNHKVNNGLLGMLIFCLFFEVLVSFFFTKLKFESLIVNARIIEGFILFFIGLYYCLSFGYDRIILLLCSLFLIFPIICFVMISNDIFPSLRYIFSKEENRSFIINTYLNYPIALAYLIFEVRTYHKMYIDSKLRIKLTYILYPITLLMLIIMYFFDKGIPYRFESHTIKRRNCIMIIYWMIIAIVPLSFWRLWKKEPFDPKTKEPASSLRVKCQTIAKFPMFFYVFFISDETERLLMLLGFFSLYYLFIPVIRKAKNIYWKLICFLFILMIPDMLYIVTKNTFSFDISLRVTNKCIGYHADDTPIMTGILMGTHKLKFFMLTAAYFLYVARVSKSQFMKDDSFMFRLTIDVQLMSMICLYFYFLVKGYEENYLQVFIWIMAKCMICVIFDIAVFLWHFVLYFKSKPLIDLNDGNNDKDDEDNGLVPPGQSVEQVIEMEEKSHND